MLKCRVIFTMALQAIVTQELPLLGSLKELGSNTDCWGLFLSVMRH
jgi:hypothetical protein